MTSHNFGNFNNLSNSIWSSLGNIEIIELITKQYMDIEIFGSLDRKRKVLDYISATRLKPKRLLSCEYVLQLEKYSEEDELEV